MQCRIIILNTVCLLFSLCYFALVLCPTLFTSGGVFLFSFFFFPAPSFQVFATSPAGGGHDSLLLLVFIFLFFSFDWPLFFLCFLSFLYSIECVCRACRIQYDDMALHCPLLTVLTAYQVRGNVVSLLWRSLWPQSLFLFYLIGLKNRHGHWLCWMSTGRKNGLMWRTHTYDRHDIHILWNRETIGNKEKTKTKTKTKKTNRKKKEK